MLLAFRLSSTSRRNSPKLAVPAPAKPVDLERYLGLWYELGRLPNRFEQGCEGVTAEYAARSGGIIDVVNTCRQGAPDGARRISRGRAKIVASCGNAKLKVSFFGPFYLGNYWVLDHADDYAWSIVGEPSGRFLWILSRDPTPAEKIYDELVDRARAWGYDMARFRRTRQPPA
jgi:apolipoprotein D and lipocalin family protein